MNELDPALQRLLKWSRGPSVSKPETAPFGFSTRVVPSMRVIQEPTLLQQLQETAWSLTFVSLALMVCGGLVLLTYPSVPSPAAEISSALTFVANQFPR